MYKEAKLLLSSSKLTSSEVSYLEKLILGGIEYRQDEAKFYKAEFNGVYGLDKAKCKSYHVSKIARHIVSGYLEDDTLENIKRNDYPIYLLEHRKKAYEMKLKYVKSVYQRYMEKIKDTDSYIDFRNTIKENSDFLYLMYSFWLNPSTNCSRRCKYYLNHNKLSIGNWCYSGFYYNIKGVSISFDYCANMRLLALNDSNNVFHYYKINTLNGRIENCDDGEPKIIVSTAPFKARLKMIV